MLKKSLFAFLTLAFMAGCAVHTPGGSVVVDPDRHHGKGTFCPPGQAKKGNC